jgi:4-hydroxythreonine-4-phosphate dehydrogenase
MARVGLTVGDPAGIGPEVVLKALSEPLAAGQQVVVYGPLGVLAREDARLSELTPGRARITDRLRAVGSPGDEVAPGEVAVVDVSPEGVEEVAPGAPTAAAAAAQGGALRAAIAAAKRGELDALCTAPWTKSIFALTGEPTTGHTEVLAREFDAPEHVMMLAGERLRVALATTHLALKDVSAALSVERIVATIGTTAEDLRRWWGVASPRIAVCGLNPHAGEGGVMGREELDVISPAIEAARARYPWVELSGPMPSDTLFAPYGRGEAPHDAVVCMYHDQGLIPLKLLHFGRSANITLGLPVARTSVDHGTAYDIAGRGVADGGSMRYALELAFELAARGGQG